MWLLSNVLKSTLYLRAKRIFSIPLLQRRLLAIYYNSSRASQKNRMALFLCKWIFLSYVFAPNASRILYTSQEIVIRIIKMLLTVAKIK